MSVILKPQSGAVLQMAMWRWRATTPLVRQALDLDEARFESLHEIGGAVSAAETQRIADHLQQYLANVPPDGRVLIDGSVTREPDTYELHQGENWDRNYSASYASLREFQDFCRTSGGFTVL